MSAHLARGLCLFGLAVCLLVLLAPTANAAVTTKRDGKGDYVRGKGLSGAQRRSLDITSVRAVGEPGFGLWVTVTFAGNFERAVGRGRLNRALVALILEPRSRRARRSTVVHDGRGHYGRTRRNTRSRRVHVLRRGRRVMFVILGTGIENVRAIRVASLTSPSGRARRAAVRASGGKPPALNLRAKFDQLITGFDRAFRRPTDDCDRLPAEIRARRELLAALQAEYNRARKDRFTQEIEDAEEDIAYVKGALEEAEQKFKAKCGRKCAFSFSPTGQRTYVVSWRCDEAHKSIVFDYNAGISLIYTDIGNARPPVCRLDSTDATLVRCSGDFAAGTTYVYAIETVGGSPSCSPSSLFFDPTVDGNPLARVGCPS